MKKKIQRKATRKVLHVLKRKLKRMQKIRKDEKNLLKQVIFFFLSFFLFCLARYVENQYHF